MGWFHARYLWEHSIPPSATIRMFLFLECNANNHSCIYYSLWFICQQSASLQMLTPCVRFDHLVCGWQPGIDLIHVLSSKCYDFSPRWNWVSFAHNHPHMCLYLHADCHQDDRRVSSMLWSMLSKAAERSRRQRQDTFCAPIALMRWSWRAEQFQWSGAECKQTGGILELIGSKMFSKSRFNNTFDDFRYERQIRNRTIVWELVLIKIRFFKQRRYYRLLESGMELTRAERQIDYVSDSGDKRWSTFLKKPGWDRIRIRLLVRKVEKDLWDFGFSGTLKVEKLGGVVNGAGEWRDIVVERAPRDRRSLDILSVKKEAKLSASEVNDVEVSRGEADLRQSNLFTVCQRWRGLSLTEKIRLE